MLGSYNLPYSHFPKNKGILGSNLALTYGINCMGSAHMCIGLKSEHYDACFVSYSHRFVQSVSVAEVLEEVNTIQFEILHIALA